MIAAAHFAAGVLAGMASTYGSERPLARLSSAFGLGVLSHMILDAVPHSDYAFAGPSIVLLDALVESVVVCSAAVFILRPRVPANWRAPILMGIAGAVLPDAKFVGRAILPMNAARVVENAGDWFHSFFHAAPMSRPMIGLWVEMGCTVLLLASLALFPRTSPGRPEV